MTASMPRKSLAAGFLLAAILLSTLAVPSPGPAWAQSTQPAVWSDDQAVDEAMGAFEDPGLIFVLTLPPEPDRRFELFQPFGQQPPAANGDFSPTLPGGPVCRPAKGKVCP